jgi:aryl-alcohol dehydrogenase-like predicted oxidoreductase
MQTPPAKIAFFRRRLLFRPDGPMVSEIGFGAWPIGGGLGPVARDQGIATVQAAVKLGLNFIDTADYYENCPQYDSKTNKQGGSETVIGLALQADAIIAREAFVTTKVSKMPHDAERIRTACDASLKALQLDMIPLYAGILGR